MKVLRILVFAVTASLVLAATALAQSPTGQVYGGAAGEAEEQVGAAGDVAAAGGTLPFTGLDLAVALAAGVVLIAVGFTVRRLAGARG